MIASGKIYPAEGVANNPLFAAQVPAPATLTLKADAAVKPFQIVSIAAGSTSIVDRTSFGSPTLLGVTAHAAEANKPVEVYTCGSFNVDALDVSAITDAANKHGAELADAIVGLNSAVLHFKALSVDTAVPTV